MRQNRIIALLLVTVTFLCLSATPALARDIFIAGDSTASVYGPEVFPRMGWGQVLGDFYGDDIGVVDLAQSGRSSRSFIDEGFFADLAGRIGAGDILLIQFGHNDEKIHSPERYTAPETDFKTYLQKYIDLAHEKDATPVLLTPIVRRKFEDGKLVPTHGKYPGAMRELAADTGTALIDMTRMSGQFVAALGEEDSKTVYLYLAGVDATKPDNTHFTETGAYAMASLVARGLDALKLAHCKCTADAAAPGGRKEPGSGRTQTKTRVALQQTRDVDVEVR